MPVAEEAFCDRGYLPDGTLADRGRRARSSPTPTRRRRGRCASCATNEVEALDGTTAPARPRDTLCVHGDTPGAAAIARRIRAALESSGVTVERFS